MRNTLSGGFKITIEAVPKTGLVQVSPVVFPQWLGDYVAALIGNALSAENDLQLIVRVENWNETFDHEETVFDIRGKRRDL